MTSSPGVAMPTGSREFCRAPGMVTRRRENLTETPARQAGVVRVGETAQPIRDCRHPKARHVHGTRNAYVCDRCRCAACRDANRISQQQRRRAIAYGHWEPYVDAQPARAHVHALGLAGVGLRRTSCLSGVPHGTLSRLMRGSNGRPPGSIRAETARRVLSIPVNPTALAAGSRVDASGTRRRLQALVAIGWPIATLAARLGRTPGNLRRTMTRQSVTVGTARAIRAQYEQVADTHPPDETPARRAASQRAREHARSCGWTAPLGWDDIDTDPDPSRDQRDTTPIDPLDIDIAADRLTNGRHVHLTDAERDEVVRALTKRGHSIQQIAEAVALSPRTVSRRRRTSGAA
jgi:hypothetical protein